jgi:hypothetical protein
MGMYDSIMLNSKCPKCGKIEEREFQTKDLDRNLDIYKLGDCLEDFNRRFIETIVSCHSEECAFIGNISDILWQETPSGFDLLWGCKIKLDDACCITNEIYDIEIMTKIPDNWEDIIKHRFGDYWRFLLEKYNGDKKKAADEFGYGKNRRRFITMIRKMDYGRLTHSEIHDLLHDEPMFQACGEKSEIEEIGDIVHKCGLQKGHKGKHHCTVCRFGWERDNFS